MKSTILIVDLAFVYILSLFSTKPLFMQGTWRPACGGANGLNRRSAGVNRSLQHSEDDMKC